MKFKDVDYKTDLISYPIKFEIFTSKFFEREEQHIQALFLDPKFNCKGLSELVYKTVINKSRCGRVVLVKNFKTGRYFALKYFHKWKMTDFSQDDFFQKLALRVSRFVRIIDIVFFSFKIFFLLLLKILKKKLIRNQVCIQQD